MDNLRQANRGQSIQIGAVLLFGILVIWISLTQAYVIPEQNAEVEYKHMREVTDDMKEVRAAILNVGGSGTTTSVTVELGTEYPTRLLGMNPPPPSGTLRAAAEGEIAFNRAFNVENVCGYSGTARALVYDPNLHEYQQAPTVGYDNSVIYRNYSGDIIVDTEQALIRNDTIQITPLNATYSSSGTQKASLTFKGGPVNGVSETVNEPLNVTLPTRLPAETWETNDKLFGDVDAVQSVEQVDDSRVNVTLEAGKYTLACRAVGIDSYPASGSALPPGVSAGGYGKGSTESYDPDNPESETLATKGGKLTGIVNASFVVLERPSFTMTSASSNQISGTQKRYLRLGLKLQNESIGRGTYKRYFFVVGPKEGLSYQLKPGNPDNISWQKLEVSLYMDTTGGESKKLFDGKKLAPSVLTNWLLDGDELELLAEENYQDSDAVRSDLEEVQAFMNNSDPTSLVVTNLHGRVNMNVTDEVARSLGGAKSQTNVVVYRDSNSGELRSIGNDSVVHKYDLPNNPKAFGRRSADLDVGGLGRDIPFKGGSNGYLRGIAEDNSTGTLSAEQIKQQPMGVGDWDDDNNQEVLYTNNSGYLRQYEPARGAAETVVNNGKPVGKSKDVKAVAGVGNFDNNDANGAEVVYVKNQRLYYMSTSGGTEVKVSSQKIGNNKGLSTPADFDGDDNLEVAVYNSNNNEKIYIWDDGGQENSTQFSFDIKSSPMAASNWVSDSDSTPELMLIDNNNQLRYVEWPSKDSKLDSKLVTDDDGDPVKVKQSSGVR